MADVYGYRVSSRITVILFGFMGFSLYALFALYLNPLLKSRSIFRIAAMREHQLNLCPYVS
jgi:hypothetical protein